MQTVPCLLARMAAIIDRHAFTAEFLEKGAFSTDVCAHSSSSRCLFALALVVASPVVAGCTVRSLGVSALLLTARSLSAAVCGCALSPGRFSKQHFTEDLEIYEAIAETGEIDILRPKRNARLGEAIECGDEGFIHFLKEVCLQIQPDNRPFASEVRSRE